MSHRLPSIWLFHRHWLENLVFANVIIIGSKLILQMLGTTLFNFTGAPSEFPLSNLYALILFSLFLLFTSAPLIDSPTIRAICSALIGFGIAMWPIQDADDLRYSQTFLLAISALALGAQMIARRYNRGYRVNAKNLLAAVLLSPVILLCNWSIEMWLGRAAIIIPATWLPDTWQAELSQATTLPATSPNGSLVASSPDGIYLTVTDNIVDKSTIKLPSHKADWEHGRMKFSQDGKLLIVAFMDVIAVYNVDHLNNKPPNISEFCIVAAPGEAIRAEEILADDRTLVLGEDPVAIRLYDLVKKQNIKVNEMIEPISDNRLTYILQIARTSDGSMFAVWTNSDIEVWDSELSYCSRRIKWSTYGGLLAFTDNRTYLIAKTSWNANVHVFPLHPSLVTPIASLIFGLMIIAYLIHPQQHENWVFKGVQKVVIV